MMSKSFFSSEPLCVCFKVEALRNQKAPSRREGSCSSCVDSAPPTRGEWHGMLLLRQRLDVHCNSSLHLFKIIQAFFPFSNIYQGTFLFQAPRQVGWCSKDPDAVHILAQLRWGRQPCKYWDSVLCYVCQRGAWSGTGGERTGQASERMACLFWVTANHQS